MFYFALRVTRKHLATVNIMGYDRGILRNSKERHLYMKKRIICFVLTCALCGIPGCASTGNSQENPVRQDMEELIQNAGEQVTQDKNDTTVTNEEIQKEETTPEETQQEQTDPDEQENDLTFADLAKYDYSFLSGAGGWSEEFQIEKDGFFHGMFHDSEMGSTGEGYPNGTMYYSIYTGHFGNLIKVDEYSYEMQLLDISYKYETGTEEIIDEIKYIYSDSYCLGGNTGFKVYVPGTPLSNLSESVVSWLRMANGDENTLTMYAIVDEKNEYGIFSSERVSALEEADMCYFSYQNSWNVYGDYLADAQTTQEMKTYLDKRYELADECMNYLWRIVKYNVSEEKFEQLLQDQREWLAKRDENATLASAEFEGGTFAAVAYAESLATDTIERCSFLLTFLQENVIRN